MDRVGKEVLVLLLWNLHSLIFHPKHMQFLQHVPQIWSKAKVSEDVKAKLHNWRGPSKLSVIDPRISLTYVSVWQTMEEIMPYEPLLLAEAHNFEENAHENELCT